MKFIMPDGMVIEEGRDGILFDIELAKRFFGIFKRKNDKK